MSGRKIGEKMVSIPEVKELMENVKDKVLQIDADEGMSHFQEITYNYVNKYAKISAKDAKKILNMLKKKYELEEIYMINIVNIDPKTVPELRVILEKSYTGKSLSDEQLQEMLAQIGDIKSS